MGDFPEHFNTARALSCKGKTFLGYTYEQEEKPFYYWLCFFYILPYLPTHHVGTYLQIMEGAFFLEEAL